MKFAVIDLETTSREAAEAHIVEWACILISLPWFGQESQPLEHGGLVRPPIAIPPETSAVHHIIDADVAGVPTWEESGALELSGLLDSETVCVAHNAEYERTVLKSLNLPNLWLCTYKAALRAWPDAPAFSNEALRYWLGFGTGRSEPQHPHTALHDARVTAGILHELHELQNTGLSVADMIEWTNEPALLPKCPIGDWRGHPWAEVDEGFLLWIMRKQATLGADVVFCSDKELRRRQAEHEKEHAAMRAAETQTDETDIPF